MIKWNRFVRNTAGALAMAVAVSGIFGINAIDSYAAQTGTVTASVLNVRSGPSTSSSCVTTVKSGTTLEILSTENGWYKINLNGQTAYVSAQYVSVSGNSASTASGTGVCNVTSLNVRSGASTSTKSLGLIKQGASVTILGSEGSWYKVSTTVNGASVTGYVYAEYITVGGTSNGGESTPTPSTGTGTVNAYALNIRSGAGTNHSVIGTLKEGAAVTITGTSGSWLQITATVNGKTVNGYVSGEYITKTNNSSSSTGNNAAVQTTPGTVTAGPLNVRAAASMSGKVMGTVAAGTSVSIIATEGSWYKVNVKIGGSEVTGYVSTAYVSTSANNGPDNSSSNTDTTYTEVNETVWATAGVNIRKEASTSSASITVLAKGASITRTGVGSNGWSRVKYGTAVAYIKSEYLTTTNPSPSVEGTTGQAVVNYALQFEGNPYVWGGNDLNTGVDCSGFTSQVYLHFGITLNRTADAQRANGIQVSVANAQPGDLFFYGSAGYATHVGIYIGDGKIIHASSPSVGIIISNANYKTPIQVNRLIY